MPVIVSVAEAIPPFKITQSDVLQFSRQLFSTKFKDIERLLTVFQNSQIESRHFAKGLDWFAEDHSFEEKNNAYIETALHLSKEAIIKCLQNQLFARRKIDYSEIDAILFISSTGIATPSMEARIMNELPFDPHTKRIPIWGLGCAGGASGLSRAHEFCLAYPKAKVLVVAVELCSLTFQRDDLSKSNLIGTSLFADGVACALVVGDEVDSSIFHQDLAYPHILATQSTLMKGSLDVMGWEIKNSGLYVVFSKDIPSVVSDWLQPNVTKFLSSQNLELTQMTQFVTHPGGKKVLDAYIKALEFDPKMIRIPLEVLKEHGNMSSATILYVLNRSMKEAKANELGLACALGPGFSSELLSLEWRLHE